MNINIRVVIIHFVNPQIKTILFFLFSVQIPLGMNDIFSFLEFDKKIIPSDSQTFQELKLKFTMATENERIFT